jgi:hypothetical protein
MRYKKTYMEKWSLRIFLAIDYMMVHYKRSYSPIQQYMPKQPEKWRIQFWVLAHSVSKLSGSMS